MLQQVSQQNLQSDSSRDVLKVTLLGGGWNSSAGGLATFNRELGIHLSKHPKVEVSFLVPDGHCTEEDKREAQNYGIAVVGAKKRAGYDPLDWLGAPPEGHQMDIVVGHGAKLGKQVQFIKESARFHNCKWVQVVHTAPEDLSKYKDYPDPISKGEEKHEVEVDLCKFADLVVPVGPRLGEAYSSYLQGCKSHQDVFTVIPGLFEREFGDLEQSPNENTEFKVLLCGRGDEEDFELKGYDIAVKAFTDHRLQRKRYRLLFVGAPEGKQDEVRKRLLNGGIADDQLTVRKFIQSRQRMKDLLCEADLVIMPSRSEGYGLVGLEALSAGLPILVSSKSGFARALETVSFGDSCIVDSDDPAKWAEAIERVGVRHSMRLKEIQKLRKWYGKRYSWNKQCENLVKKLWSMVNGMVYYLLVVVTCSIVNVTTD